MSDLDARPLLTESRRTGLIALALSILAVWLCATIWLGLVGGPLGLVSGVLGLRAVRTARQHGARSVIGAVAVVLSALAVASVVFFGLACNVWLTCV